MRQLLTIGTLICMFSLLTAHAQTSGTTAVTQSPASLVGTWAVEWEIRRVWNDAASAVRASGRMAVEVQGDSFVAKLVGTSRSDGGRPTVPVSFDVKSTDTGAVFVRKARARVTKNGEDTGDGIDYV